MEICEMLKQGKAYRIFLSKQTAEQMTKGTGRKYNEGDELILCELGKDKCPYKNQEEGILIPSIIDGGGIFSICKLTKRTNKLESNAINN